MKTQCNKITKNLKEFLELSNFDIDKVKNLLKSDSFAIYKISSKKEIKEKGYDYNYPYEIYNPFNLNLVKK